MQQNSSKMRAFILTITLLIGLQTFSQKKCDYTTEINDSIGTYKETRAYLMHEKVFAGKSTYLFFSLLNENGTPLLKIQKIVKSADFIPANCFDSQSKIYLQLLNGKIITLIYGDQETCGSLIHIPNELESSRVLTGNFLFLKGSIEDLKSSPIWEVRIRYANESNDFAVKKEFISELMKETFMPETYFINYLHCVTD